MRVISTGIKLFIQKKNFTFAIFVKRHSLNEGVWRGIWKYTYQIEYQFPEKFGLLNMFNTLGAWKSFLIFIIESDMMPRGGALCPPKNDVFAQSRASKFKTEIETKRQFPVLLAACLSQTTGGAFCLDECPKNVISCNIIWRHPSRQIQDIFCHWCEKLQNGILSSPRA